MGVGKMRLKHKHGVGSKHRERIERMRMHAELLLNRLEAHDPEGLPESVDIGKLEKAYEKLSHYHFVLRKVNGTGA